MDTMNGSMNRRMKEQGFVLSIGSRTSAAFGGCRPIAVRLRILSEVVTKTKRACATLAIFFFVFLLVLLWFQKHLTFDANKLCLIKLLRKHLLCTGKLFSNAWIDNKRWNVLRQNPHADARFRCLMALFNECPELENLYYNRTHVWDNAFIVWNNINYLQKKGVTINKQVRKW